MTISNGIQVSRAEDAEIEEMPWGRLHWRVSAKLGNSQTMTVGSCFIEPGQQNGVHMHPNCDEVLTVVKGHIEHSWNEQKVQLREGDAISIPAGVFHNARNLGGQICELAISFSSARRETVGHEHSEERLDRHDIDSSQ